MKASFASFPPLSVENKYLYLSDTTKKKKKNGILIRINVMWIFTINLLCKIFMSIHKKYTVHRKGKREKKIN